MYYATILNREKGMNFQFIPNSNLIS